MTSDIFIQQKIKAEIARKKLEFIDRENEVMREKAKLRADSLVKKVIIDGKLKRLKAEEDTAIAEVGVKILEDLPDDGVSDGESDWTSFHTSRYVENQNTLLKSGSVKPKPVGPSDMTDENRFGPAENISFPDRMSGNVFSDNELKKCPKRFNIKNTISQIVFSCGFIFDSREQTFGTIFLLPYVHDKLYCMKSPMFKTLK